MANFNEKVNSGIGYILNSQEFFIYRSWAIKEFARMIHDELYLLTNTYRLFIQYKTTHRGREHEVFSIGREFELDDMLDKLT